MAPSGGSKSQLSISPVIIVLHFSQVLEAAHGIVGADGQPVAELAAEEPREEQEHQMDLDALEIHLKRRDATLKHAVRFLVSLYLICIWSFKALSIDHVKLPVLANNG